MQIILIPNCHHTAICIVACRSQDLYEITHNPLRSAKSIHDRITLTLSSRPKESRLGRCFTVMITREKGNVFESCAVGRLPDTAPYDTEMLFQLSQEFRSKESNWSY